MSKLRCRGIETCDDPVDVWKLMLGWLVLPEEEREMWAQVDYGQFPFFGELVGFFFALHFESRKFLY